MRFYAFAIVFALLGVSLAYPYYNDGLGESGSKTWGAIKNFFRPVGNWFSEELPKKSPADLVDDAKDLAVDVKNWAQDSYVGEAVKPVGDWVQGGVDYVKDKKISTIYGDVKDTVSQADETVGGWINKYLG